MDIEKQKKRGMSLLVIILSLIITGLICFIIGAVSSYLLLDSGGFIDRDANEPTPEVSILPTIISGPTGTVTPSAPENQPPKIENIIGDLTGIRKNKNTFYITVDTFVWLSPGDPGYDDFCGVDMENCPSGVGLDFSNSKTIEYRLHKNVVIKTIFEYSPDDQGCLLIDPIVPKAISVIEFFAQKCEIGFYNIKVLDGQVIELIGKFHP